MRGHWTRAWIAAATVGCGASNSSDAAPEGTTGQDSGATVASGSASTSAVGGDDSTGSTQTDGGASTTGDSSCPNHLLDGGFEGGTAGAWTTDSVLFGTPLCDPTCLDGVASDAREGQWWLWFGGQEEGESAHAAQSTIVPPGAAVLSFYLRIPTAAGTGDDILAVTIDGTSRLWIDDTQAVEFAEYAEVTLELPELGDRREHEIAFAGNFPGTGVSSFYIDSVALRTCTR